jgi:hypothetical protein
MKLIQLPIRIIDKELDEMGIEQEGKSELMTCRADLIETAYPSTDKDGTKAVHVNMVSGDEFQIYMSFSAFINLWTESIQ